MLLVLLVWLFITTVSTEMKSSFVDECINTTKGYNEAAKRWNCTGNLTYHCLLDAEDNFQELCANIAAIGYGYCPRLRKANTSSGITFDWISCKEEPGLVCPKGTVTFYSNEVYKFSGCLHSSKNKDLGTLPPENEPESDISSVNPGMIVAIVNIFLAIIAGFSFWVYRLKTDKEKNKNGEVAMSLLLSTQSFAASHGQGEYIPTCATAKGKDVLDKSSILVCVGTMGSGRNAVLRQLADIFKDNWKILTYKDYRKFKDLNEKYLWILDDLFGHLNFKHNEADVKDILQNLETIVNMCNGYPDRCKMIFSVRNDIFNRLAQKLLSIPGFKIDDENCVYIDLLFSQDEFFSSRLEATRSICRISDCGCKTIGPLSGELGTALILQMLNSVNHVDLFPNDSQKWQPLLILKNIFTEMIHDGDNRKKRTSAYVLMYMVLQREYNPKYFNKKCAKQIHHDLNKTVIELTQEPANIFITSVTEDSPCRRFKHDIYYIAAFHACWDWKRHLLIKHCNMDAILQLCRIQSQSSLEVELETDDYPVMAERLQKACLTDIEHPLKHCLSTTDIKEDNGK